ncbi:Velvet domain-containing protein [Pleurotus pulmonarius]
MGSKPTANRRSPRAVFTQTETRSVDGSVSILRYAAFRVIPYYARHRHLLPVPTSDVPDSDSDSEDTSDHQPAANFAGLQNMTKDRVVLPSRLYNRRVL